MSIASNPPAELTITAAIDERTLIEIEKTLNKESKSDNELRNSRLESQLDSKVFELEKEKGARCKT